MTTELKPDQQTPSQAQLINLDIGGMTCASCAARIEKKLTKLPGVTATVNFATETAHVELPPDSALDVDRVLATVAASGYSAAVVEPDHDRQAVDAASAAKAAGLRRRLIVSATLGAPVVVMSMVPAAQFDNWWWWALGLATPVVLWGGWPFHRAALINARHGAATMDTLISIGVLTAYLWSTYVLLAALADGMHPNHDELYFEVSVTVTTLLLLGRLLEDRAKRASGTALRSLLTSGAPRATLLRGDLEIDVPATHVRVGDSFVVRPGSMVVTDGRVVSGRSALDTSLVTGEPWPVEVSPGDLVVGGTTNHTGSLVVQATAVGADTQLARIAALVEHAQTEKSNVARLVDRVASVFVPVVLVLAALTFIGWLIGGASVAEALAPAVAVLIIACPCALGLATPTALLVGTGRAAELGIIISGPQALESSRSITTVVMDKTGTLTTGDMTLTDVISADVISDSPPEADPATVLSLAASVEAASEHPIAKAIVQAVRDRGLAVMPVEDFTAHAGFGVTGQVGERGVAVGRLGWLADEWQLDAPQDLLTSAAAAEGRAATVVGVAWDGQLRGLLVVADVPRDTSAAAVAALNRLGLSVRMLTGDNAGSAQAVANTVGISDVIAGVDPEAKLASIVHLQREGHVVAMVGDGINDAAALAQADLGIAMNTGTDAAMQASDLTLMRPDLRLTGVGVALARRTMGTIRGNLFWAFAYNVAAIPLAMSGLLSPMIAGAAMVFSSLFVLSNSLRLRRFSPNV